MAVAFGVLAVYPLGLQHHGVKIVGHIGSGLPSFGLTGVPATDCLRLAGPAVGIMLAGLGAANLAAGPSGGMVVNGSTAPPHPRWVRRSRRPGS